MGQHRSASASRLLGLDGLRSSPPVVAGGQWRLAVQTTATAVDFRGRGARAELHDRRTVRVRDLPSGGCPVVLSGASGSGAVVSQPARYLGRAGGPDPSQGGANPTSPRSGLAAGRQGRPRGGRGRS
jgi:hypothetical protein